VPTGTVTFKNGTTVLGTVALVNGVAKLTTSNLPAGNNNITATYNGSTAYAPSTGAFTQAVNAPGAVGGLQSFTQLSATPTIVQSGQSVTFTATVTGGGPAPTGYVIFVINGVRQAPVLLSATGTASIVRAFTSNATVQAIYTGDPNYFSSTSNILSFSFSTSGGGRIL
jgi:hypothetical protein